MQSKHAIVIDSKGFKVEFALVNPTYVNEGEKGIPYCYTMKDGESLVYEGIAEALSMLKPRWDGKMWEETATREEIEAAQPAPMGQEATGIELLAAELSMAMAQMQQETAMAIAELSMAIAAIGGV